MILVVGATGQLGTAVVSKLASSQQSVRAFVRQTSNYAHLQNQNLEIAFGDLRDEKSVHAACKGADIVIATANAVIPISGSTFQDVEGTGYQILIDACKGNQIRQFIFVSVSVSPHDQKVPTFRYKRWIENRLVQSGIPYTVFRASLFMDDWLALIGSSIPLRGADAATLNRPFWFSQLFLRGVGHLIEKRGLALIPGNGKTRHAFITLEDVASFLVNAIDHPKARNATFNIGGPEILSWDQAVEIFGKVLGRKVRALHTPPALFRFQQILLTPFSPAAANLMGLNWITSFADTPYDMKEIAPLFGVSLTSVEQFLRQKLSL